MSPAASRPSWRAKLLATLFGLALALAAGELVAAVALRGAYPTLNLYEADPVWGVRLTPDAETRVASPNGTPTDYRTNALGFRGPQWPAPARDKRPVPGRVLVVGDSQVMGWGVPEDAVFTHHLATADRPIEVLAAGVPTWGPIEYTRAVTELAARYRPERVVYLINAANDWLEAPVPNPRRTTARDGWARVPLGPDRDATTDFPLRRFLLGRSHLVIALRMWIDPPSPGLAPVIATRFFDDLAALAAPDGPHRSRLTRYVLAARDACRRAGCELIPALLPADLQVDPDELGKYGVAPRDTRPTLVLGEDLAKDLAEAPGLAGLVDLRPALVAASPGAFLPDDYHLSPAGHAVVARVLRERLAAPSPRSRSQEVAR